MPNRLPDWRRSGRLAGLAVGLALMASAVLLVLAWFPVFITPSLVRRMAIALLQGVKITVGVVLVGDLVGAIVLGALFLQARQTGKRRPLVARGLLLCGTCLIGLGLAEAIAATWGATARSVPREPAREPELPKRFARSDDGEVTLAVVGESSAAGTPYERWLSVGQIVAWQLGNVIPGRRFRALVLAKPAETLESQYRRLAGLRRRPDALIVYCGHNEFSARIPWSRRVHHYRDDVPSLVDTLDQSACRVSALYGLIERATDKFRVELPPSPSHKPPLVDSPAYSPAEFAAILGDFRRRLEAIAGYCERLGVPVILVVPPANDAGFEPVRSYLPPAISRAERDSFARAVWAARRLEARGPRPAIERYRALLARYPGFAECHYRLAGLLEKTGAWDEAYEEFIAARDSDGMPMRCLSAFQQVYGDVARSHGCILVDGQALFHAIGPHGLLDDTLFNDVMHPSLRGHIALATAVLDALRERGTFGWPRGVPTPTIDPARCAAHFGLHSRDWTEVCAWGEMFYSAAANLLYDPTQCRAKRQAYQDALGRIKAGESPESVGLPNVGLPAAAPLPRNARAATAFDQFSANQ